MTTTRDGSGVTLNVWGEFHITPPPIPLVWVAVFGQSNGTRIAAGPWAGPAQVGTYARFTTKHYVFGDPHGVEVGMLTAPGRGVMSGAVASKPFADIWAEGLWDDLVADLATLGVDPQALPFIHGEGDSTSSTEAGYLADLNTLRDLWRAEYGDRPIIVPVLQTTVPRPNVAQIIAAQRAFAAAHADVVNVETEGLTRVGDFHYDSPSFGTLGGDVSAELVTFGVWT